MKSIFILFLFLMNANIFAVTQHGAIIPDSISLQGKELQRNGLETRKATWFSMKILYWKTLLSQNTQE